MGELEIRLTVDDGVGTLEWADSTDPQTLEKAVSTVADDALLGHELRRLEVAVPTGDAMARRALHRAGFRLEGVRRQALRLGADDAGQESFADVALYARLASDVVYGRGAFSSVMNTVLPRKRVIAHVLYRNDAGQVLYCETSFKTDWELPGGVIEPLESPRDGARREIDEELGVDLPIGRLLVLDWMPPYLGWEDAVELIFDGGVLDPARIATLVPDGREIVAVHWVSVDDAAGHLIPLAADRLRLMDSLGPGETLYTESGRRL